MVVFASLAGINWLWGVILWIVVGLIAGWLIHSMVRSGGTRMGTDLIAGLIGGVIAGIIMGFFVSGIGFWWAVLVAFVVGLIVDGIVRAVSGKRQAV